MVARKQVKEESILNPQPKECQDNRTQYDIEVIRQKQLLTISMIDKANELLRAAGDGSGELKIKQVEKAIEIYKAIMAE